MSEIEASAVRRPVTVVRVYSKLDIGGIENQLLNVLPRIEARGRYRTVLILTRRGGELLPRFRDAGLNVEVLPLHGRLSPSSLTALAGRFRELGAGIVHAHVYEANTTATVAAWFAGRPPVIASIHNMSTVHGLRRRTQDRLLGRFRSAVVCVSEEVRRNYVAEVGVSPEKVVVLYNGIDLKRIRSVAADPGGVRQEFRFPPESLVVVCAARLVPQKDHGTLLEAFARVAPRHPRARLLVAGDGPERGSVEARSRRPDLEGRVVVAGGRSDVPRLLRAADICALSSLKEGFSNVVLESLAAGLPLVVTDVGGNREAMDGERTGLLVPPGDPDALAAGLDRLLGDELLRRKLSEEAWHRADRFDLERTADETESLYARLLARRPGRA